jgi:hypothetical protein
MQILTKDANRRHTPIRTVIDAVSFELECARHWSTQWVRAWNQVNGLERILQSEATKTEPARDPR